MVISPQHRQKTEHLRKHIQEAAGTGGGYLRSVNARSPRNDSLLRLRGSR